MLEVQIPKPSCTKINFPKFFFSGISWITNLFVSWILKSRNARTAFARLEILSLNNFLSFIHFHINADLFPFKVSSSYEENKFDDMLWNEVKGHFYSDYSALTNRPDTKTELSLIFLRIFSCFFGFFAWKLLNDVRIDDF